MKTKPADGLSKVMGGAFRPKSRPVDPGTAAATPAGPSRRGLWPAGLAAALLWCAPAWGSVVLEEAFNYPAGTALVNTAPWSGSAGSGLAVMNGSLTMPGLLGLVPPGNMLQRGGGAGGSAYVPFGNGVLPDGDLYCSFLINSVQLPTSSQFVLGLLPAGSTQPNQPDDPLDFYVSWRTNGCVFSVSHTGSDPSSARVFLTTNQTHFIVLRYTDGLGSQARLYLDPPAGSPEPATPNAITEADDGGAAGTPVSQMRMLYLSGPGNGLFQMDTLRVGTQWADVAPSRIPLSVSGPADVAACSGGSAVFRVTPTGTPPFSYQWRSNSVPIAGATGSTLTLTASLASAAAYDVMVTDTYSSMTSGVAQLTVSHAPPVITSAPTSVYVPAGAANATFSLAAAGDGPLTIQWRTNGVAIPGATNSTLILANPTPADALNSFDVVVANPCGSVASAAVQLGFVHQFLVCDALPGFFSGMNLFTTNGPAVGLFVWSSPDPSQPITSWLLEGQMAEQPLNDGTGNSRYSLNVNPLSSLMYYIIGATNTGPYLTPVPVQIITTDSLGNYALSLTNVSSISPGGVLGWTASPVLPTLILQPAGKGIQLNGAGPPGGFYWLQASSSLNPPVWVTVATNAADALGAVVFSDAGASGHAQRFYRLATPTAPVFLQQPQPASVLAGQAATFNPWVTGAAPMTYQWFFNGTPLANATAASLTLPNVKSGNAGAYTLVAGNSFGTVTSSPAPLSVSSQQIILPPAQ